MKKILYLALVAFMGILGYTLISNNKKSVEPENTGNYTEQILQERKDKDAFFKTSEESPIEDLASFTKLNYFAPDSNFKILASITTTDNAEKVTIQMSDGTTETYTKYGWASFSINQKPCKLLIYEHDKGLSIMFRDATAPKETYGGGRYLDFKKDDIENGKLTIDFNKAYNPYCVYNHSYSCPIPPTENTLAVRIEAGEKL